MPSVTKLDPNRALKQKFQTDKRQISSFALDNPFSAYPKLKLITTIYQPTDVGDENKAVTKYDPIEYFRHEEIARLLGQLKPHALSFVEQESRDEIEIDSITVDGNTEESKVIFGFCQALTCGQTWKFSTKGVKVYVGPIDGATMALSDEARDIIDSIRAICLEAIDETYSDAPLLRLLENSEPDQEFLESVPL